MAALRRSCSARIRDSSRKTLSSSAECSSQRAYFDAGQRERHVADRGTSLTAVEVSVRDATIDQARRASIAGAASQANAPRRGPSQLSTLQVEPAAAKNRASEAKM